MTMTTVTIRVGAPSRAGAYPVSLEADDGKPRVAGSIAGDFGGPPGIAGDPVKGLQTALLDAQGPAPQLGPLGSHLFGLLATGPVAARWKELAAGDLRVLLEAPALRDVPWELLREGPLRLATRDDRSFARICDGPAPPQAQIAWPLRILVIVGSQDAAVAADEELRELDEAFRSICGLVDVEVCRLPSAKGVADVAKKMRPHILHVISHGDQGEQEGPRLLMFDGQAGTPWTWTADRTAELLPRLRPRMVVLNACRTAGGNQEAALAEQAATWGLSDAFLALGVGAVLAMQGDISGPGAGGFSRGLYKALSEGDPVDVALTAGRRAVMNIVGDTYRDWALPVLTTAVPPEQILLTRPSLPIPVRNLIEARIKGFIDRSDVRREVWSALALGCEEPQEADALAIVGSPRIGKSTLVGWCLDASALHGRNVAYVDLASDRHIPVLGVLGLIAEVLAQSPHHGPRNRKAFDRWLKSVDKLLGPGAKPGEIDPAMGRYHRIIPQEPPPPEHADTKVFGSFRRALQEAADGQPLILALDHVHEESLTRPAWESYLVPMLLGPIAAHELEPVRLILVLREDSLERRLVGALEHLRPVPVGPFPKARVRELARTRLLFEGFDRDAVDGWLAAVVREPKDWVPERLDDIANLAMDTGVVRVQ